MSEQVIIRFGRSHDPRTDYYNIYRSTSRDVGRHSPRIMKVRQSNTVTPVAITEVLLKKEPTVYVLANRPVLLDEGFTLHADDAVLPVEAYDIDAERGLVFLAQESSASVRADYFFDGVEVTDDRDANDPEFVEHYGPALSSRKPPPPPNNVSLVPTPEGMRVNYQVTPTIGSYFYYAIEAVSNDGSRSALSRPMEVYMSNDILNIVLEWKIPSADWKSEDHSGHAPYLVHAKADGEPPEALSGFTSVPDASGVTFHWDTPLANGLSRMSPEYRVRVRGLDKQLSAPSRTVGPELYQTELHEVAIYQRDGSLGPPTHTATNATKVASIPADNDGSHRLALANGSYAFSLYVVDKAGNHSLARTAVINING